MAISFVFIFFIIISPTYINSIFIKNIHKIIGFPSFIYPINNSNYCELFRLFIIIGNKARGEQKSHYNQQ